MIMTTPNLEDLCRITGKITVDKKTECWNYSLSDYEGYRKIYINGKQHLAHRFMFQLFQDNLPDNFSELVVHHRCNNKMCVYPYHLEAVTQQVNVLLCEEAFRERNRLFNKLILKVEERSDDGSDSFTSSELKRILESNKESGNNFLSLLEGMKTVYDGHFDYWRMDKVLGDCGKPVYSYMVSISPDFIKKFKANQGECVRYVEDIILPDSFFFEAA